MTREEVIAILENEKKCVNRASRNDYCNRDCYNCELVKTDTEILNALDTAIEALEQEPCEDYISRQAAIDAFEGFIHELGIDDEPYNYGEMALSVENVPPITPQQKTGQWILSGGYWRCSNCNEKALLKLDKAKGDCREYAPIKSNFCSNCGRKMEDNNDK